jgi:lysozyme
MGLVSDIGLNVLKEREGVRLTAYKDSVGVWTIGWGHTAGVKRGDRITRETAEAYLAADIDTHAAPILAAVTVPLEDHEADALVSVAFNIGVGGFKRSTFLRKLNAGDKAGCAEALLDWNKPPEIKTRRAAERAQFLTPYSVALPVATLKASAAKPSAPRAPAAPRQWAEDGLAVFEVRSVQERLRALGYFMVGKVDGSWGDATTAAIVALQKQAGITADGHYGPETKAALADDENKRLIPEARKNTTAKDLRNQGSTIAIDGNRITWTSILSLLAALVAAGHAAYTAPAEMPFGSSVLLGFLPPPFGSIVSAVAPYLLAFAPLAYNAFAAQGIVAKRVDDERIGLHNGEAEPAPEHDDAPDVGGLFGSLFRKR